MTATMLGRATLLRRLSLVFAVLLLACCGLSAWIHMRTNAKHEQEVVQRLSGKLAAQIAGNAELMQPAGLNTAAVKNLFDMLMAVNPSVEVYLLGLDGKVLAHAAPEGHLKRDQVDLAPVRRLLAGAPLPVLGDDPRSPGGTQVFSAAPLRVAGRDAGYVYVVLLGEDQQALAATVASSNALRTAFWSIALVAALGLLAGLVAFRLITRPLRRLTAAVDQFRTQGMASLNSVIASLPPERVAGDGKPEGDEIAMLADAFGQMARHMAAQWRELTTQDQQRRELFANISHDLRTPLTSLHGYLETLLLKGDSLDAQEQRRYLGIALAQSQKVGRLAQELFELARLEYGVVKPDKESFALADLVQDVFQKFELAAGSRQQRLVADIAPGLPVVHADLGMIERVLTNLLDNAIRHTPEGGEITVALGRPEGVGGAMPASVLVEVRDTGPGIPEPMQKTLFTRPAFSGNTGRGGLGLLFVQRILQLHGSEVQLVPAGDGSRSAGGAAFRFRLGAAD